ncbi:modification methylase HemK [Hanseniaspora valbyensis NRRL Y-1626]|uniref:Modification methylase HemK n=1 Tax=Hanseniaspora valbyensis NRRL Y-1626 TaxID=766949 RepID=A0A1B7TE18_9ASCO|nr:modification methylase HemK [Hanseniaspora valbyensis NRRL Y-1626]
MRISYRMIQKARLINPLLPYMLPQCRNLQDAKQELIWLEKHFKNQNIQLAKAVIERFKGKPLQYILKNQPFGEDLTINCRPNVLIPRWETDEFCHFINTKIFQNYQSQDINKKINIVDLCSGSGCISLSIKESNTMFNVFGVDISDSCINLANENKKINSLEDVEFIKGDILNPDLKLLNKLIASSAEKKIDMIISNPPYILHSFLPYLNTSVKKYEPSLALFGNLEFYENFVKIWSKYCDSFFYELGEIEQFEYINSNLDPKVWAVLKWSDSNDKIRGVYGYRKHSQIAKMFDTCK